MSMYETVMVKSLSLSWRLAGPGYAIQKQFQADFKNSYSVLI